MGHCSHLSIEEREDLAVSGTAIYRVVWSGRPDCVLPGRRKMSRMLRHRSKEFARARQVQERLGIPICFCEPHHPWQKPSVENTNGLIREFFPKGTDFSKVTDEEVQHVFDMINDRPRKVLGFRTANEVYREMLHLA